MKKTIRVVLVIAFLAVVAFLLYRTVTTVKAKQKAENQIQVLDEQLPFLHKGFIFPLRPVIINYFDPGCSHCQYMTEEIVKNEQSFSNSSFVMVTEATKVEVDSFITRYALSDLEFLSVRRDSTGLFYKTFGTRTTPSFFIYNKEHQLVKTIKGETKIENILNALNENATK